MKTVSYPLYEKTLARSYLTASVADLDPRVSDFRLQKLGSVNELLKPEEVEKWIQNKWEADKKNFKEESSTLIARGTGELGELKRQQSGFETSTSEKALYVYYGKPGQEAGECLPSIRGGVIQELRILADDISRDYGWHKPEATMFILSGMTPKKPLITWEATPNEIVLRIHPSIPPELVEDAYRQAKRKLGAKTMRERGRRRGESIDRVRDLFLAQFISIRVNRKLSPSDLLKKWNKLCGDRGAWQTGWGSVPPKEVDNWAFEPGDVRAFNAACDRIKGKLLETRIGKEGVEQLHQIAIDTLLSLNPHFTRANPEYRPELKLSQPKLTVNKVAAMLGVKTRTHVYRLMKNGSIPQSTKINGSARWHRAEIERVVVLRKTQKTR